MEQAQIAEEWTDHARQALRKQNLAWWLEKFTPMLVMASLLGFCAILFLRAQQISITALPLAIVLGAILFLCGIVGYFVAKNRFLTLEQAFVRLESHLKLRNSLTAASRGHATWPNVPPRVNDGVEWKWSWIVLPVLVAALSILGAMLIPIEALVDDFQSKPEEPLAWPQMEEALEQLEEEKVLDQEEIEQLRQQIEELREKPAEEWYDHNTMEATDHLQESLNRSLEEMARDLDTAERSLDALENQSEQLSQTAKNKLLKDFEEAMQGLKNNDLKLNKELMDSLKSLDLSKMKQLSKEQMKELRQRMKKASGT